MRRKLFFLCSLLGITLSVSAQEKLILFTKPGCSNCAFARSTFRANNVPFQEYPVDDPGNARRMIAILGEKHYRGSIVMPVMLYRDTLQFPVREAKDTLVYVSLQEAVRKIILSEALRDTAVESQVGSDSPSSEVSCEFEESRDGTIYCLVTGNFPVAKDAAHFLEVMRREGYTDAKVVEWDKFYRVVIYTASGEQPLMELLAKVRERYHGAYILKIPR